MRHSQNYNLRLPERLPERNDPADIDDLTYDMESIDSVLKAQDTEDKRLERDKAKVSELNAHKVAAVLDHPDRCVTDDKIGTRTVLTTSGLLQTLLTAIGNAIKLIVGTSTWNDTPPTTLLAAKVHMDSRQNPHVVTKAQVGLGNADNTSDTDKPVSTSQATAIQMVQGSLDVHKEATSVHLTEQERALWNTVINKANTSNVLTKDNTTAFTPTENYHPATKKYIDDQMGTAGGGDMMKAVYDQNGNGIVDNAEKVNGLTVQTAVPAGAKFTDTVYSHPATHPPGIIAQDGSNRFVTDGEKAVWNGKAAGGHVHDDRYFTESEVNALLAGRIPTSASCNKNWNWSGQGGQPSWVWGGGDGTNMYVYNPSNFNVNYANSTNWATSAGNADTVDGYHIAGIGTAAPSSLANNAFYFVYE